MKQTDLVLCGLVFALLLFPAGLGWCAGVADHEPTEAIVISGHRGAVLAMDRDDSRGLLFTAGIDGSIKIWNMTTRSLVRSITVTSMQAAMLAVNPETARFAVLATDTLQNFSLEVWDWQKGEEVFKVPLTDQPLFLRYSASGRYLLYGLPRWDSLHILNASDGTPMPFHPEGFGIVGFAALSRSEKILMTYRLTGAISYWDLASGKLMEDLQSVPLLSRIRLSPDLRFIAGSTGSEMILIDLSNGQVQSRAPNVDVTSLDISPAGDEIACVAESGTLSRWGVAQGTLTRKADPPEGPQRASIVRFTLDSLVLGSESGALVSLAADGTTTSFPSDERAVVTGIAVRGNSLALGTSSWIKVFTADLGDVAKEGTGSSASVATVRVQNPFKASIGLTFLDDDSLLVWQSGDGPGLYAILDLKTGSFASEASSNTVAPDPLGSPIIEAQSDRARCVFLASDGTLRVMELPGGAARAQMRRPGSMSAALSAGDTVIIAGQPGDAGSGSLVRINIDTGETVPIPTANRYTYEVLYDGRTGVLYSLGVAADGTTNLLAHTGKDFQTQSVVESTPGEHLTASLCFDNSTGILYSSLGREQISRWKQGGLTRLPASARGTVRLLCSNGLLYSLNRDSSVSIFDAMGGQSVAELSVFTDSGWALVMPDGKFAVSAGSQSHVSVLQGDKPVQDTSAYVVPVTIRDTGAPPSTASAMAESR